MDHFTQEKNSFAGVFFYSAESNINSILYTITKTKMTGQVYLKRTKIQERWTKVFFHFILLFSLFLYGCNKRTTIDNGDIELLHCANLRRLRAALFIILYLHN